VLTETAAKMLEARPLFRGLRVCRLTHVFPVDAAALPAAAPALTDSPGPPPGANGADKGELTITLFGFLNPGKRIEDLLDAFEILADRLERENAPVRQRLSIFGGVSQGFSAERWLDALRDRIRRSRHSDRIEFAPGFVSEEERDARLARADIVVLPFRATPGIVFSSAGAVRAMGLGKAIAASRADTMEEEIADEVTGLLYPEGDAQALAERLYRLSLDSALRRRLGAQARRHIWSEHSPARVAEELRGLYR
jgi:glycosyltransferase involved in cell wall biosynthesis